QLGFGRVPSSRASKKQEASRENELVHFPVCPPAFSCAQSAQVARLCRAARERIAALPFLFAIVAVTATNAALSCSLSGSERERPRSYLFPIKFVFSDALFSSGFSTIIPFPVSGND
ncbi:MAG: hypothetical protein IJ214_06355, partial [Clostridia bacterium]|nr:hypothetical protein [Clostridia bacterium]